MEVDAAVVPTGLPLSATSFTLVSNSTSAVESERFARGNNNELSPCSLFLNRIARLAI